MKEQYEKPRLIEFEELLSLTGQQQQELSNAEID